MSQVLAIGPRKAALDHPGIDVIATDEDLRHHPAIAVTLLDRFDLQRLSFHQATQGLGGGRAKGLLALRRIYSVQTDGDRATVEPDVKSVTIDDLDQGRG